MTATALCCAPEAESPIVRETVLHPRACVLHGMLWHAKACTCDDGSDCIVIDSMRGIYLPCYEFNLHTVMISVRNCDMPDVTPYQSGELGQDNSKHAVTG